MWNDLLPNHRGQSIGDLLFLRGIAFARDSHGGVDAILDRIHERVILDRDLRDEHLSAVVDQRLEKAQEAERHPVLQRQREYPLLFRRGDAG